MGKGLIFMVLVVLMGGSALDARADPAMQVPLNMAVFMKLDRSAAQVVIGNPAVADVTVQPGGSLTLFGKSQGATSLMVLDGKGRILRQTLVVVAAGGADSLGVTYATGRGVPLGGQRMAVECAGASCAVVRPVSPP